MSVRRTATGAACAYVGILLPVRHRSRCCYGRRIQVNPYELARLSRGLGITTTEVIARFTVGWGNRARDASRHGVHVPRAERLHRPRRPAARVSPLSARPSRTGRRRTFVENEPHPETEGLYGQAGTVGSYLESQSVEPFIAAADRYHAVFTQLMLRGDEREDEPSADIDPRAFIDADLAIQTDAASRQAPSPVGVDALVEAHLALIEHWAQQL